MGPRSTRTGNPASTAQRDTRPRSPLAPRCVPRSPSKRVLMTIMATSMRTRRCLRSRLPWELGKMLTLIIICVVTASMRCRMAPTRTWAARSRRPSRTLQEAVAAAVVYTRRCRCQRRLRRRWRSRPGSRSRCCCRRSSSSCCSSSSSSNCSCSSSSSSSRSRSCRSSSISSIHRPGTKHGERLALRAKFQEASAPPTRAVRRRRSATDQRAWV
mmetsp:Transcript_106793/g.341042  ORF Transcript_106793/g.341042 Transcript_106793/m.341042 type:complete len:214 (+) Transcript_106793:1763-2404(+)